MNKNFIDKILKMPKKAGKKEKLVRWKGWAPKYDSWVSEADVQSINRLDLTSPGHNCSRSTNEWY